MPYMIVGMLLDDGGREVARVIGGIVILVLLALLLAVAAPAILLASPAALIGARAATDSRSGLLAAAPSATQAAAVSTNAPASAGAGPGARPNPPSPAGSEPVDTARHYLGVPYVFGGTNPAVGLDCSGLVQLVFRQLGVSLPRTAQLQYDATRRVAREDLRPGDLVFFARTYDDPHDWVTHVGIYMGNGLQINAPTEGQVVSIQPVFSGFWGAHYAGGGRVVAA